MGKTVKLITKNFHEINPESLEDYIHAGGYKGLKKVMSMSIDETIDELNKSTLKGRGGAYFPTGLKWDLARGVEGDKKIVICNADEGEPCTFKDRHLLEFDPFRIIEGLMIAGYVFGADTGYIYIREEYEYLLKRMQRNVKAAKAEGYLGNNIFDTDFSFDIKIVSGAGAYVCGEETSLMESIEGKSGRPRLRPPYIENGIFGLPTMVNNVETLSMVAMIFEVGSEEYLKHGTFKSPGTKLISLAGNVNKPGAYEVPFGVTLREIIYDIGGGMKGKRPLKFIQLGGASGAILPESVLDTEYCHVELAGIGASIGSGAILVADDTNRIVDYLKSVQDFFLFESCGKCTPCREGNRQLSKIINRFSMDTASKEDFHTVDRYANVMKNCSFCGLGKTAPTPLLTAMKYFSEEFYRNA